MRLRRVWLKEYLNLEDVTIDFNNDERSLYGTTNIRFFVGVNGSGKSNALEAIGLLFGHLLRNQVPDIQFDLEYSIGAYEVRITNQLELVPARKYTEPLSAAVLVRDAGQSSWSEQHHRPRWPIDEDILPKQIVGYSTGPTTGLAWALVRSADRLTRQHYGHELQELSTELSDSEQLAAEERNFVAKLETELSRVLDNPSTMFLNASDSLFAVVPLLAFAPADIPRAFAHLRDRLLLRVGLDGDRPLASFSIEVVKNWEQELPASSLEVFRALVARASAHVEVLDPVETNEGPPPEPQRQRLVFDIAPSFANFLAQQFGTPKGMFERLLSWYRRGIITTPQLALRKLDTPGVVLDNALSDGEFLFLGRYGLLLMMREVKNVLVLLDEPETHFNDQWKVDLVKDVRDLLDLTGEAHSNHGFESDVIIATHSDLTLTDAAPSQVYLFKRVSKTDIDGSSASKLIVSSKVVPAFAANRANIARDYFELTDPVGSFAQEVMNNALNSNDVKEIQRQIDNSGPGFYRFMLRDRLARLEEETENAASDNPA